jgi:hypothetical protein
MVAETSAANLRFCYGVSNWTVDDSDLSGAISRLDIPLPGEQGLLLGLPS